MKKTVSPRVLNELIKQGTIKIDYLVNEKITTNEEIIELKQELEKTKKELEIFKSEYKEECKVTDFMLMALF